VTICEDEVNAVNDVATSSPEWRALVARARELTADGTRAILGIVGARGAGKGDLARALLEELVRPSDARAVPDERVAVVSMEGFRLGPAGLHGLDGRERECDPAVYDGHGYVALLRRLAADQGHVVHAPAYDRFLDRAIAGSVAVPAEARLVITDGPFLLLDAEPWTALRTVLDEAWFCDTGADGRVARLVRRNLQAGRDVPTAVALAHDIDHDQAHLTLPARSLCDVVVSDAVMRSVRAGGMLAVAD
jgi:pantothenate kinase